MSEMPGAECGMTDFSLLRAKAVTQYRTRQAMGALNTVALRFLRKTREEEIYHDARHAFDRSRFSPDSDMPRRLGDNKATSPGISWKP